MAGFDLQAIDPQYKAEILEGLVGGMESIFLRVFTSRGVNSSSGKIPILPSKHSLRSGASQEYSKIALDAAPELGDGGLTSADFRFDGKYSRKNSIPRSVVEEARNFGSAEELLAHIQRSNMIQIAGDIDADGASILASTSLNTEVSATAVWSDSTNARPVTDMDALMDTGGNTYDTLWMGESRYREFAALPAIVSFANNYSAVDARAPKQVVANWLFLRYPELENVIIEGVWHNTAAPATTISTARLYDDVVWAGKRDHMIALEYEAMREMDEGYDTGTQNYHALATLWLDVVTGEDIMTATLSGT